MEHIKHLSRDKRLKKIIKNQEPLVLVKRKNVYLHLCASIISQQLSTKVARIIQQRFLDLFKSKTPRPEHILAIPVSDFRAIGLSNNKAAYVHNVCTFFLEHKITDAQLLKLNNEEVIELLSQIKGVGRWTVEMILMFTLGREDVFAVDDLGIQQALIKLYDLDVSDKKALRQKLIDISVNWSPYRTYACRYLWGWKDA